MRILHAVHDYLPEQVAGVEVYSHRVATAQAQNSANRVGILYAAMNSECASGEVKTLKENDVSLFALVQNRNWSRFEQTWRGREMRDGIERVLDDFRPDVIHVQHLMNLGIDWLSLAEARAIPVVMTLHDQWLACAQGGQRYRPGIGRCEQLVASDCATCTVNLVGPALSLRGRLARRRGSPVGEAAPASAGGVFLRRVGRRGGALARLASAQIPVGSNPSRIHARWAAMRGLAAQIDRFIAPSRRFLDDAVDFGLPANKLTFLPHGLPAPVHVRSPLPDLVSRFGYAGSLVPHKGVHLLIEAFESMPPEATLDVYGSFEDAPDYVAGLRSRAKHRGVRFHGECEPAEMPARLAEIECLVAPSVWAENAPLGVQEAFLAGCPVIASDLGGHRELLAGGGGLLFEPDRAPALLAAMLRFATEKGAGRRAAETIPKVRTLDEHVESLNEIYRTAGNARARMPEARPATERVVLLDRDGVINYDRPDYVRSPADWQPIPGSLEAIARLTKAGYRVAVVTNQSGLARRYLDEAALREIHVTLQDRVSALGGRVDTIAHCPHGPDDGCDCRKPLPGLIFSACRALGVEPQGLPLIGDRQTDMAAARAAGCRPIFVRSGIDSESALGEEWEGIARVDNLEAAVELLLADG